MTVIEVRIVTGQEERIRKQRCLIDLHHHLKEQD